jgi:hypothetical protein
MFIGGKQCHYSEFSYPVWKLLRKDEFSSPSGHLLSKLMSMGSVGFEKLLVTQLLMNIQWM